MNNSISYNVATVLARAIESALQIDSEIFKSPKYTINNRDSYFLLTETWFAVLEHELRVDTSLVTDRLRTIGLVSLIKESVEVANAILFDTELPVSVFTRMIRKSPIHEDVIQSHALRALRYPKRFSPSDTVSLAESELAAFLSRNNRAKLYDRRPLTGYWHKAVNLTARAIFGKCWTRPYPDNVLSTRRVDIPTGASYDVNMQSKAEKLAQIVAEYPELTAYNGVHLAVKRNSIKTSRYASVPKSYKSRRIIAASEPVVLIEQQWFVDDLWSVIRKSKTKLSAIALQQTDINDQQRNRDAAREGSITCATSTLDLSAASDSLTPNLISLILPPCFFNKYMEVRDSRIQIDKNLRTIYIGSLMGARVTFPVQTLFFFIVAVTALDTWCVFNGCSSREREDMLNDISVYGDDIIVPTAIAELVIEALTALNCIVNVEKSFYGTFPYRESCGVEYLSGYDLTQCYYPRAQFPSAADKAGRYAYLISLQHKLCGIDHADAFLRDLIRQTVAPRFITFSPIGTDCTDIWSDFDDVKIKVINDEPKVTRELHAVTCNKSTYRAPRRFDALKATVESYIYNQYLQYGPRYDSPLDHLLGVTTSRYDLTQWFPTNTDVRIKVD